MLTAGEDASIRALRWQLPRPKRPRAQFKACCTTPSEAWDITGISRLQLSRAITIKSGFADSRLWRLQLGPEPYEDLEPFATYRHRAAPQRGPAPAAPAAQQRSATEVPTPGRCWLSRFRLPRPRRMFAAQLGSKLRAFFEEEGELFYSGGMDGDIFSWHLPLSVRKQSRLHLRHVRTDASRSVAEAPVALAGSGGNGGLAGTGGCLRAG